MATATSSSDNTAHHQGDATTPITIGPPARTVGSGCTVGEPAWGDAGSWDDQPGESWTGDTTTDTTKGQ